MGRMIHYLLSEVFGAVLDRQSEMLIKDYLPLFVMQLRTEARNTAIWAEQEQTSWPRPVAGLQAPSDIA